MNTLLAPLWQVLRKLCMFKFPQSQEPLPGHCCSRALSPADNVPLKLSYLLAYTSPSLRGWEAFPTLGALTHTKITWVLLPMTPQVSGSRHGPFCAHDVLATLFGEVRNTHPHQMKSMHSSTILVVSTSLFKLSSSMVRHCVYLKV